MHGVKDAGETLGYSWNLPYISKIEKMLEEADNADSILVESDENDYTATIERYLYGDNQNKGIIPVPRKSIDIPRKTIEYKDGALEVYSEIGDIFLQLKEFIIENEIDNNLKKELLVDIKNLGKNLKTKQITEVKSMVDSFDDAFNLYLSKTKFANNQVIEISQKTYSVNGIILDSILETNPDIEKMFYELPQKTLLSLPTELSLLWMVVEGFENYIRERVLANKTDSILEDNKNVQEIEEYDLEDTESSISNNFLDSAAGDTNIGSGLTVGLNQIYSLNNKLEYSLMYFLKQMRKNHIW